MLKNIDFWFMGWAGLAGSVVTILTLGRIRPSWEYNTIVRLQTKRLKEQQILLDNLSETEW